MYAPTHTANQAYRNSAAEHTVETADGYTLIASLMTRFVARLSMAKHCIGNNDVAGKGEHLSQAVAILDVLQVAVDDAHDSRLAENLVALYGYATRRLLEANLKSDVAIIDEVEGLVREVKSAWDAIGDEVPAQEVSGG